MKRKLIIVAALFGTAAPTSAPANHGGIGEELEVAYPTMQECQQALAELRRDLEEENAEHRCVETSSGQFRIVHV